MASDDLSFTALAHGPFALPARLSRDLDLWMGEAANFASVPVPAAALCPKVRWWLRMLGPRAQAQLPAGIVDPADLGTAPVLEWTALVWGRAIAAPDVGGALYAALQAGQRAWERVARVRVPDVLGGAWTVEVDGGPATAVAVGTLQDLVAVVAPGADPERLVRVIVEGAAGVAPWLMAGWTGETGVFDRVVRWEDQLPASVTDDDAAHLRPGLVEKSAPSGVGRRPRNPWFACATYVVPKIVRVPMANGDLFPPLTARVAPTPTHPDRPVTGVDLLLTAADALGEAIEARPMLSRVLAKVWPRLDQHLGEDAYRPRLATLVRDHVRSGPGAEADIDAVARALRFQRVGVALSGGGATAFRAYPVFQGLKDAGVPVDVLTGVSGGALVAALHASDPDHGLENALKPESLTALTRATAAAMLGFTRPLKRWLETRTGVGENGILGSTRLACYPVAVRVGWGAPRGTQDRRVVAPDVVAGVAWGLADAVLASGAAPLALPPVTEVSGTFVDGGVRVFLPVQALAACGADFLVGLNGMSIGYTQRLGHMMTLAPRSRVVQAFGGVLAFADDYMEQGASTGDAYLAPSKSVSLRSMVEPMLFWQAERTAHDWRTSDVVVHGLGAQVARVVQAHGWYLQNV